MQPRSSSESCSDLDAEFTLAWICINDPDAIGATADLLQSNDFSDPICARIWAAFLAARRRQVPFNLDLAVAELAAEPEADPASVRISVDQTLALAAGTGREAEWCVWRVREGALCRQLLDRLEEMKANVVAGEIEAARSVLLAMPQWTDQLIEARNAATQALARLNS